MKQNIEYVLKWIAILLDGDMVPMWLQAVVNFQC